MKNSYLKKLFLLSLFLLSTNSFSNEIYTGKSASDLFPNAKLVRTSDFSALPSYISFYDQGQPEMDEIMPWMKKYFKLGDDYGFKLERSETDELGFTHHRFLQTLNGNPLEFAVWVIHEKNNRVYSMNGLVMNGVAASSVGISEESALERAKDFVGAETFKWEDQGEENHLKWETNNTDATYYPKAEMVYIPKNGEISKDNYKLSYKFNIYAHSILYRAWVYVDAMTGEVLFEDHILHDADALGTGETAYSGTRDINTDSFGGEYRLRDVVRGLGVNTYNMNEGTSYAASTDFTDADNDWTFTGGDLDQYAIDAHWGAEMTYDYFDLVHSRNSIDDSGFPLNSYVHYDVGYVNAFWDGSRMTYGDGNATYDPLTSIDIAGHEIAHGLCTFTANLTYSAESGALNESFSDIFGTSIENYARPADWNWLIGEDIGGAFRSMSNPNAFGDPDTYFGTNWASLTGGDSGGVHTNSGVQNFWYYLLTEGGTGTNDNGDAYDVTAQGFAISSSIAFRNLTVYLTPSSQFDDARFYSILSAIDLYGACSPEVEATTDAWYAVGVGPAYVNEVTADFSASITESCSAPFTVDFTNTSINATSYTWDFGDGASSIVASPSHTYATIDTFTVSLIADGGACGIDTLTLVDYIVVDTTLPCVVSMPSSGFGSLQTGCDGTLYDSGGDAGNYGGGEDAQITINPFGASGVSVDFVMFDVEAGSGATCNYDYLEMYDGPNTSSPLIGQYCNTIPPPATFTASGSAITFVFHSDGGLEEPGFEIEWQCILPDTPPVTDFASNVDTSCTGIIDFTDESSNGPTSWAWDFGDGSTSTEQNPTHTYTVGGLYTVELTATNGIGSDTETKTDYIFIELPSEPTIVGDTICAGEVAELYAFGTGDMVWYDAPGGTELFTGDIYSPTVTTTTSFYVSNVQSGTAYDVGPNDNSFGGGGYFTGNQHLLFDCFQPVILKSVKVFANSSGNRTIELRNNVGTVLESLVVFINAGEEVIDLNFDIPVGTNLQLGTEDGSAPDLYRNNSGPAYPYTESGIIEITQSSAGLDYYYFFYDWQLEEYPCESGLVEVVAVAEPSTIETISGDDLICIQEGLVNLSTTAGTGVWLSDCGACIDPVTGVFDPSIAGIGNWIVSYNADGECVLIEDFDIEVSACLGLSEKDIVTVNVYPNPSNGQITVSTSLENGGIVIIKDVLGRNVLTQNFNGNQMIFEPRLADGTYFLEVIAKSGDRVGVVKIILQ